MNYPVSRWLLPVALVLLVASAARAGSLVKSEYFFDTDPGVGNGTAIALPAGESTDTALTIPRSGASTCSPR